MKLDRAIEILDLDKSCDFEGPGQELEEALQLGIGALKREEWRRARYANDEVRLLPGETVE